jgi:uncharacterized protein YndB with AHSA1/START domain
MAITTTDSATAARRTRLVLTRDLRAPPERVYKAWTQRRALAAWMGPEGIATEVDVFERRVGGRYRFIMRDEKGEYIVSGRFLALEPFRRLSFTWSWENGAFAGIDTVVEITLSKIKSGTRLTLVHRELLAGEMRKEHRRGWRSCLDRLARRLASAPLRRRGARDRRAGPAPASRSSRS